MFKEKQEFKCLFKIPLQRENDNTAFYFLTFLVKLLSENSISIPIHHGIISLRNRGGEGGTDEQPLSDKPPLIRCGEICIT